jgi:hypothetical protein
MNSWGERFGGSPEWGRNEFGGVQWGEARPKQAIALK